jgi:hypothetical protein
MKARPLRFPTDLAELDQAMCGPRSKPGRAAPHFADDNHTYVAGNYKYVYHADPKNPAVCFVIAAPVGPRREEGSTVAVVAYPDAMRIFKGSALPDKDVEQLYALGIPSASALTTLGLMEQQQPEKKK